MESNGRSRAAKGKTEIVESREMLLAKSEIFEQIARYEDMMHCMTSLVEGLDVARRDKLDKHERTMLAVAFKHVAGARRSSWRSLKKAEEAQSDERRVEMARQYRESVADELRDVCTELLQLLDDKLLPYVEEAENDIYYHKMKGDYYRYLAEVEIDDEDKAMTFVAEAAKSYIGAVAYAETDLAATHPIRLGLILNYSVFLHEMKDERQEALAIAKKAYDEAVEEMETTKEVDEKKYSEAANLISLLGENIRVWTKPSGKEDRF